MNGPGCLLCFSSCNDAAACTTCTFRYDPAPDDGFHEEEVVPVQLLTSREHIDEQNMHNVFISGAAARGI